MLLGPLAQVKGISSGSMSHSPSPTPTSKSATGQNPLSRAFEGVTGALTVGASNVAGMVQHGATELGTGALSAARSMGDAARNLGEEVERRRELIGKHLSQFAHQAVTSIYSGGKDQKALSTLPKWLETMPFDIPMDINGHSNNEGSRGRIFGGAPFLSRLFGGPELSNRAAPDEIVPMIHPSGNATQRLFFGMVHLYLLLILIVSFPAHLTTRTKLVITRKSKITVVQPVSDSDSEEGSLTTDYEKCGPSKLITTPSKNGIKGGFSSFGQRHYRSSTS